MNKDNHFLEGEKRRNFDGCPFRTTVPSIYMVEDAALVNFKVMSKPGISMDVALEEVFLVDRLGNKYDEHYENAVKLKSALNQDFTATVNLDGGNFVPGSTDIVLFFSTDKQGYEICYRINKESGTSLIYVMGYSIRKEKDQGKSDYSADRNADRNFESSIEIPQEDKDESNIIEPSKTEHESIPKIEEYKKALFREAKYLQSEGGRKHKITNGRLINQNNGLTTYAFELESELNLTDDAQITLYVGTEETTGSVLICEGFQIVIVSNRDFGRSINQAMIGVEPWKLLEALGDKLDSVSADDKIAMSLIEEGTLLAKQGPLDLIPKGQSAAIDSARKNDITIIWGPPGTGKTYTMAQIAKENLEKGNSVLIVSHSNVSVDGVIKQTAGVLRSSGREDYLKDGLILRYGYVRDDELSKDPHAVAYNYVLNMQPRIKERIRDLNQEKSKLKSMGNYHSPKGESVEQELKKLRALVRSGERQYVEKARLVATTISKVTVDPLFEDKKYDVVMFDEVSMAYVPQIICAATYAMKRLVLVGDFQQLAPIVQSSTKNVLGTDIFTYLGVTNGTTINPHPWLVMLNEQRRMHPAISEFPNRYVYHKLLVDHESVRSNRQEIIDKKPLPGVPISMINLTGTYCAAMKNSDNSRFNILSAIIAFHTALQAEKDGEGSIGIITPYAAQTRLIRAMIQDYRKSGETNVTCSTVHQFQGSQRNLIIFDAVESYPSPKVGFLMGKDLSAVTRLINVAITRAKGKLIVIANGGFWLKKYEGTSHVFYRLIKYLMTSGKVISAKEQTLAPYIDELPQTKYIRRYHDISKIMEAFSKDILDAHEKIVISIPDGVLDAEAQGSVLEVLNKAATNGIRVLCKSAGYKDLPDKWKRITWGSENAVFPLIVVDDKLAWYGLPISRGRFSDGNTGFITVYKTVLRIQGEHLLEMIKAFSELEYRVFNGQRNPLLEKRESVGAYSSNGLTDSADDENEGKEAAGLDRFIRNIEKCPKCKNPMTLTRGRSGKCYLKCSGSSCKETKLLSPDTINWYINRENVTCPIHHCDISAGLGKYGVYVRCANGHFMKPDEI